MQGSIVLGCRWDLDARRPLHAWYEENNLRSHGSWWGIGEEGKNYEGKTIDRWKGKTGSHKNNVDSIKGVLLALRRVDGPLNKQSWKGVRLSMQGRERKPRSLRLYGVLRSRRRVPLSVPLS